MDSFVVRRTQPAIVARLATIVEMAADRAFGWAFYFDWI